ncbi:MULTISPECIES: hypothetical protein [Curtobacterium]|jgi:hypothetical protein|uniref:Uncharacterized protein n=2 Tax=Curtobacterium TaxID=2034 RepID=A0A6G7GBJ2_9MICO|nr:hypothetical protein [Curtobacterium flaccumfaciens]MBO9041448.1 hypothetical protein [Curtobacterium flaccumfaciens pv. flaccumfaciens]MBO9044934.1 hypothetical protein [Curtobacterium flaccumfaciens pv. flaccumfaciens]MBO9048923.1 hypothetical protein [Curtobacterium flaccumfaciens pv. flaccumfaciens]MBO9057774.1 hypothetical protein [Curtobacterium flaccumfaciens pv. flaccumfaciens]MBT1543213.1 hypothetical protein [Curtobacterium flaccumfaciens pv. flaccumfaciens]
MDNSFRPRGWTPKEVPTIWLDHTTGQGVTREGTTVRPKVGGNRKNPNLTDLLDTAASFGAERIMLTGKRPEPAPGIRHWLFVQTPNWIPGSHWVAGGPPTGRFEHAVTGQKIEVRTVEEWFGDVPLTPAQARMAWNTLEEIVAGVDDRARLMLSPAATGTNLWAWSLPKNVNPIPVSPDMAEEIRGSAGQHHYDHMVAGPSMSQHDDCVPLIDPKKTKKIQTFAHVDGRFMYASLGRELGIGPGLRLKRSAAYDLLENDPYARARFFVRFTVPNDWNHVGLLGMQHRKVEDGWYYPNRPGATGETWADAAEVFVALNAGWLVEPLEAIQFTRARPLDTFYERIKRARDRVQGNPDLPPLLRRALAGALRAILLQTVGNFNSAGRAQTRVAESAFDVPAEYQSTMVRQGKLFLYQIPSTVSERARMFFHPEFSAQIWGRGRAAVLSSASGLGLKTAGALAVPGHTLIGINGDAIYTTEVPSWSLPTEHGGGDDGKTGRLRLQGMLSGSFLTPETRNSRDALARRADAAGPAAAWANGADVAAEDVPS